MWLLRENLVHLMDDHRSLAHGRGDSLDRAAPRVADGEDAGNTGLVHQRFASTRPLRRLTERDVGSGDEVAPSIALDVRWQPSGPWLSADQDEQAGCGLRRDAPGGSLAHPDPLEMPAAATVDHLDVEPYVDAGRPDRLDQVPGHARSQRGPANQQR